MGPNYRCFTATSIELQWTLLKDQRSGSDEKPLAVLSVGLRDSGAAWFFFEETTHDSVAPSHFGCMAERAASAGGKQTTLSS